MAGCKFTCEILKDDDFQNTGTQGILFLELLPSTLKGKHRDWGFNDRILE